MRACTHAICGPPVCPHRFAPATSRLAVASHRSWHGIGSTWSWKGVPVDLLMTFGSFLDFKIFTKLSLLTVAPYIPRPISCMIEGPFVSQFPCICQGQYHLTRLEPQSIPAIRFTGLLRWPDISQSGCYWRTGTTWRSWCSDVEDTWVLTMSLQLHTGTTSCSWI